jgi:hypothetical protein
MSKTYYPPYTIAPGSMMTNVSSAAAAAGASPHLSTSVLSSNTITTNAITTGTGITGHNMMPQSTAIGSISFNNQHNASIMSVHTPKNAEIVRIEHDGTIVWANGIKIDEAAQAFGTSLKLGAEYSVGLTTSVKQRIRDDIFNNIIDIARERGSLTVDDLTFMLESSKIMEKLKGDKE